jgi:hypothetical protein
VRRINSARNSSPRWKDNVRILDLAYILALGAGIGLGSAHWAVAGRPVIGNVEVGAWTAWPRSGSREIDPYMRAYLARGVRLPLERTSFTDSEIVRPEDGGLAIIAAATPEAGNWLPLPASGRFQIRLRLYDTPISSQTGETRATNLPRIARVDCR